MTVRKILTGILLGALLALAQPAIGQGTVNLPPRADVPSWTGNTTGTGSIVLSTSPTLVTPTLGVASATSIFLTAGTAPAATTTGISAINLSGAPRTVWIDSARSANARIVEWAWDSATFYSQFVADNYGSGAQWIAAVGSSTSITSVTVKGPLIVSTGTTANQVRTAQTTAPTCLSGNNCGTGNGTIVGTDTAGILTLGTTPASGFVITFNGTWSAAPACVVQMYLAGMAVGKMPLTVATAATTLTVVTNGVAPSTGDKYVYHCIGVS